MILIGLTELLHGNAYCLYFLNGSRFSVVLILTYCPREASLHACTAVDAFERVILYLPVFQADFYSCSRTYPGTITTQVTFVGVEVNFASIFGEGLSYVFERITPSNRSGEEILYDCRKHLHFYYLSVQAMQGSMDRVITGTSAISQPGSITSKVGMLAKVGVLTFNLSRLFVPLPLK